MILVGMENLTKFKQKFPMWFPFEAGLMLVLCFIFFHSSFFGGVVFDDEAFIFKSESCSKHL